MTRDEECVNKVVRVKNLATTLPKKRTSLDLPPELLERTDEAVRLGVARSRNTLIADAIREYLDDFDRLASIDARFAEMEHDARYYRLHRDVAARFAASDAEAFGLDADASGLEVAGP